MKKIQSYFVALALVLFSFNASAQTPTDESVQQFLEVIHFSDIAERVIDRNWAYTQSLLAEIVEGSGASEACGFSYIRKMEILFRKHYNINVLSQERFNAVKKIYTQSELDQLITFLTSPQGREYMTGILTGSWTIEEKKREREFLESPLGVVFTEKETRVAKLFSSNMESKQEHFYTELLDATKDYWTKPDC